MRIIFQLAFLLIFCSCAKTPEEEVDQAIDIAQSLLSEDKCDEAIDLLEDVGRQNDNPIYLQVLASAYSCRAEFRVPAFLALVSSFTTTSTGIMTSLATMATSEVESEADSDTYSDLQTAIDILLEADGGDQPSQENRNEVFGVRKAGDMGMQILYMEFGQLGKFLNFYGNVNAAGAKGLGTANTDEQGAQASTCFVSYDSATALTYLTTGSPGGICNAPGGADIGHPNLSFAFAELTATKAKMCEGLMIITNIIDTINNLTLPTNSTLSKLEDIKTTINSFKTTALAVDPTMSTLLDTTSQAECETLVSAVADFNRLQNFYAAFFETGLQ